MPARRLVAGALLAAALAGLAGAPSLDYGLLYDDEAFILERPAFWTMPPAEFAASRPYGTGRHLAAVSVDLDRDADGRPDPRRLHRTNVLLSAVLAAAVLALASRVGLGTLGATVAAAIYAVHPTHVDAVSWASGRAELLAALGCVLAMVVAIEPPGAARRRSAATVFAGTALLALAAVHSKEHALVLPGLVLAARFFLGARVRWLPALGGCLLALGSWAAWIGPRFAGFARPEFVDNPLIYAPILERWPKAAAVLAEYAGLLVWPCPLLPDRGYAATDPGLAAGWTALVAWLAAAAVLLVRGRAWPRPAFAAAWFPVAFGVTSNLLAPIGLLMAERLLLLPSVSACLLAGLIAERAGSTALRRTAVAAACAGAVLVLLGLFHARQAVWKDADTYFPAAVAASPRSAKALYEYGGWCLRTGRVEAAEAALGEAIAIVPRFARATSLLAESLARRGNPGAGADLYLAFLALDPGDFGARKNAARLLLESGRTDEALREARALVDGNPGDQAAVDVLVDVEAWAARRAARDARVSP